MALSPSEALPSIITQVSRHIQRIRDQQMQPIELRGAQLSCLLYLGQRSMTAAELSELSGLDKAGISRAMSALEAGGYVRCDAPGGKRKYRARLHLTEAGKKLAAKLNRSIHSAVDRACRGLSHEERQTLSQLLQRVAANLRTDANSTKPEATMTEKVKLMTDSACDISPEDEARYDIEILSFSVTLDGKSYTSRKDFSCDAFYRMMENYDGIPTTAQITPFVLLETFERVWQEGYSDLIYVSINADGSATYGNAEMAAREFYDTHPEARDHFHIRLIDSGSYTMCYGYGIIQAARQLEEGQNAAQIEAFLRQWCSQAVALFTPYTLRYAAKSGRIPSAAAFVGDALGIKPLMQVFDHSITTVGKVRGERQVIPTLIQRARDDMQPDSPYLVIYGSDPSLRDAMAAQLTQAMGREPDAFCQIGPEIAINAGPRLTGIIYLKRT